MFAVTDWVSRSTAVVACFKTVAIKCASVTNGSGALVSGRKIGRCRDGLDKGGKGEESEEEEFHYSS